MDSSLETVDILRDRFRLSAMAVAIEQGKRKEMEISETVVGCISDLAFKYCEQLGKDVELFARHASRKSVNVDDVILCAHRNEHLGASLRSLADELQSQRKRKKACSKKATSFIE